LSVAPRRLAQRLKLTSILLLCVLQLGPTCLESIEKMRTEYQQRSTLMHELAVLEQEKERLKPIKKQMPDTQWNRYKQLRLAKAEIARNPAPSYDPQSFQGYDQLTFQLISAILQVRSSHYTTLHCEVDGN
jgi:hypothetical protein